MSTPKKKYADKTCIVYDHGSFVSVAQRLARDFGQVYYYSPCKDTFAQYKKTKVGFGLEGVQRINNFFDFLDEADLIVFPDIMDADLQLHLDDLGYKVWGSRRGEDLEMDREGMRELLEEMDLPVPEYTVVIGITNLREYLKENQNVWVKISTFRGDFETFQSKNYDYIALRIDELEKVFGAFKEDIEFIVDDNLPDKVEIGYDGYCVDGVFPNETIFGLEIKDLGYVCHRKKNDELHPELLKFNSKLSHYLKEVGYKNNISTEMRIGKDGIGYMTDACSRFGSPPSELYQEMYANFSEIIWEGAHGNCIDPVFQNEFGVQVIMSSEWAAKNWLTIQFDEKYKDNIKLRNCAVNDGVNVIIPSDVPVSEIGSIVATGKTLDEALAKVEEIADTIRGYYVEIPLSSIDKAKEEIEKLEEIGYKF